MHVPLATVVTENPEMVHTDGVWDATATVSPVELALEGKVDVGAIEKAFAAYVFVPGLVKLICWFDLPMGPTGVEEASVAPATFVRVTTERT